LSLIEETIPQVALRRKISPTKAMGKIIPISKPHLIMKTPMKICKIVKIA
jgi:hypothetical protein